MLLTSSKNFEIILGSMQPLGGGVIKRDIIKKGSFKKKVRPAFLTHHIVVNHDIFLSRLHLIIVGISDDDSKGTGARHAGVP